MVSNLLFARANHDRNNEMGVARKIPLTLDLIQSHVAYEPDTGHLRWLVQRGYRIRVGDVAGSALKCSGYMQLGICGNVCLAHRIAWALAYNVWPIPHQIDHINMDRSDNRLINLRAATNSQNMQNRGAQRNNRSTGVKGVHPHRDHRGNHRGYRACIGHAGKNHHLGVFETIEAAKSAYDVASKRLHGEFHRPD